MSDTSHLWQVIRPAFQKLFDSNQTKLANAVGVKRAAISNWKQRAGAKNRALPNPSNLARLSLAVQVPYLDLLEAVNFDQGYLPVPDDAHGYDVMVRTFDNGVSDSDRVVSAEVRALMGALRVSQAALAAKCGMSENYLGHRLRDEKSFTLNDLESIIDALGLNMRVSELVSQSEAHWEHMGEPGAHEGIGASQEAHGKNPTNVMVNANNH